MSEKKHIAVLAGAGSLPLLTAQEVTRAQLPLTILAIKEEETSPQLENNFPESFFSVSVGEFAKVKKILKERNVTHLILIGKVRKELLFRPQLQIDAETKKLLESMQNWVDDAFFYALLSEFTKMGIEVLPQSTFLLDLTLKEGQYSGETLTKTQKEDIRFGMYYASKIGELDIGQTVVVHNRAVLAVEAIEGTDLCLQRAGEVTHKKGGIVCKTQKKKQDLRFDIPTVGLTTLEVMKENGLHVLAVEAERTFVVSPKEMIERAQKLGIVLYAGKIPKSID